MATDAAALREPLMSGPSDAASLSSYTTSHRDSKATDMTGTDTGASGSDYSSSEDEEPAKPPPPPKKAPPSKSFQIYKRTMTLAGGILVAQFAAATLSCKTPQWPLGMLCGEDGVTCASNSDCNIMHNSTCFNGKCVDGSDDLHILCYGSCTPVNFYTLWDITAANIALIAFWCVGEFLILKFDMELGAELNEGREWQKRINARDGFDPAKRIAEVHHSWQWNEELNGWLERTGEQRGRFGKGVTVRAYLFYLFYVVLLTLDLFLITKAISPQQIVPAKYKFGSMAQLWFLLGTFGDTNYVGFYTWLIVTQFCLEVGLFMSAAATVRWPRPALVRSGRLKYRPNVNFRKEGGNAVDLADEHPGLIQDTCLLIACHESCLTKSAKKTFTHTLQQALKLFPASAVFVCDNGGYHAPVDRTQEVCEQLSRDNKYGDGKSEIQYLFIPEGNKTHAMYWTTEYWIPELVRRGECEDYSYAILIDDDVPLPPDLHVPLQTLARNREIKAVSYVIMAASEDGRDRQLVQMQDAEYKLAGFVKQFQWHYGSTLACHGAIGLWRRDVLGKKILWDHDTMFHGEDLYMGLLLHRMRRNYTIMVSAGAVVPTFAPEEMLILFRQRVTSWDLCAQRKFLTYVKEMLSNPINTRTIIIKPFLLQEVGNIILDWCRIYLMIGLGHRNFPCLMLSFVVFYALLYIEIAMFNYMVLRDRPDLRLSNRTVLLFPFYRTFSLSFRLYALLKNVIDYSSWRRKNIKISDREAEIHDLPPVPPVAHPDWWSIWHPNADSSKDDKLRKFTKQLCANVNMGSGDKQRLQSLATAYLIFQKLLQEDEACAFPALLAQQAGTLGEEAARAIATALTQLREQFDSKLEEIVGASMWPEFERRLAFTLQQWAGTGTQTMLFFEPALANQSVNNRDFIVRSNSHILHEIEELVFATRWPKNHDKVADIKESLAALKDLLQGQIAALEVEDETAEMATQARLRKMVTVLEWIQQVVEERSMEQMEEARRELAEVHVQAQAMGPEGEVVLQVVSKLRVRIDALSSGGAGGAAGGAAMGGVV